MSPPKEQPKSNIDADLENLKAIVDAPELPSTSNVIPLHGQIKLTPEQEKNFVASLSKVTKEIDDLDEEKKILEEGLSLMNKKDPNYVELKKLLVAYNDELPKIKLVRHDMESFLFNPSELRELEEARTRIAKSSVESPKETGLAPQPKQEVEKYKDWGAWRKDRNFELVMFDEVLGVFVHDVINWTHRKIKRLIGQGAELDGEKQDVLETSEFEGREINLDILKVKKESAQFYQEHNLSEFASNLPPEIKFSPDGEARIKEALKMGFNRAMILPSTELQSTSIATLASELASQSPPGLKAEYQYTAPYFENGVKTAWIDHRPANQAYLLLYSAGGIPEETKGKTPEQLYPLFKAKKWDGLTVPEYLLLQRKELEQNQDHRFCAYSDSLKQSQWTWLLDSRVPKTDPKALACVVRAYWFPGFRQVRVSWGGVADAGPDLSARPAVIVPIL